MKREHTSFKLSQNNGSTVSFSTSSVYFMMLSVWSIISLAIIILLIIIITTT
ncbi:MAG: hypothetical protein WCR61_06905 [Bacteroidales bacterium]|nr:hypothetical protein [Bacteroidales bacterium]MDD4656932.1 hypothetical protein [Bacteroidales bacterium]